MKTRWIVRERVLNQYRGNGVWAHSYTKLGGYLLLLKISMSRYRGSQPHSWRRVEHYVVPALPDLTVVRDKL